ncbi:Bug family tripartite tricarboxylate transporter substrate binding protein [Pseudonocardia nigra]|uniref:Bug family tripartite tricarboxylate transporter substrate binding protein n=1 Tax=Pseudonocardia nigra TaxID=1921578 RepID=UPI001C5EC2B2|nr:tripartite tricarboxylate transporter substrate binding protein [Pseudonocardia nigra]
MRCSPTVRRRYGAGLAALALSTVLASCAAPGGSAEDYPTRPVDVIVPYPAGGGSDALARALVDSVNATDVLAEELRVVNRGGGGGVVGVSEILSARPDGYTIGFAPEGPITLSPAVEDVPYDPLALTPIMQITEGAILVAVPASSPFRTADDLVEAARSAPGTVGLGEGPLSYALTATLLERAAGVQFNRIDFEGDAAATTALLGDNVDAALTQTAAVFPQVQAGSVRVLAATGAERSPFFPDVPTLSEAGYDVASGGIYAMFGPEGIPDDVVQKLTTAVEQALESPELAKVAEASGLGIDPAGALELMTYYERRSAEVRKVVEEAGGL